MFSLSSKLKTNQIPIIKSCEQVKILVGRKRVSTQSFYFSQCTLISSTCNNFDEKKSNSNNKSKNRNKKLPICPFAKTIFYGAIKNSDDNRREKLCSYLTLNLNSFRCYESLFGKYLAYLLHFSSIVILERFYNYSSLESHRIDPLLLQGKILISTESFGK